MATKGYHDDFDSISKSMLSDYCGSRFKYWCYYVGRTMPRPQPKKQMLIGEAVHAICLDKLAAEEVIAIYPDECFKHDRFGRPAGLNPKPAEEFRKQWSNRVCLKPIEALIVKNVVKAIADHPIGQLIATEGAIFETPFYWECPHSGLKCRMCGDIVVVHDDRVTCIDLKTTARPEPAEFDRVRRRFRYWLQDAHYSTGLSQNFDGKPVDFTYWAIEVNQPYRIAPYKFAPIAREENSDRYANLMLTLATSYETNDWADLWTKQVNYMTVSPWEFEQDGGELDFSEDEEESDEN